MEQFSQSTCWTLAEDLVHLKGQERSLHNQVGWKKEGKRKVRGRGKRPMPVAGGAEGEERFPHPGKPPHQRGGKLGQKGSFGGYWRRVQPLVCGRQDRVGPTQMVRATGLHPPAWEVCTPMWTGRGWVLMGSLESRPRERIAVGFQQTAWKDGIKEICNQECLWRKPRQPYKQSTVVEWYANGRGTIAASLLMHRPLPPRALGRTPTRVGALATLAAAASSSVPHPCWGGLSCAPSYRLLRAPSLLGWTRVLQE